MTIVLKKLINNRIIAGIYFGFVISGGIIGFSDGYLKGIDYCCIERILYCKNH
jgi:hypothetical protein